jgi:hypothetical protein
MDRGAEEHKKLSPLLRGQIANFSAQTSKTSTNRPEFATDTLAVDLRGDDAPAKKDHDSGEPAEILLLTPGGNLVVRDEIDDAASCAELSAPPKEPGRLGSPGRPESPGRTGSPASDALRRAFEEKGSTRAGAGHSLRGRQGSGSP